MRMKTWNNMSIQSFIALVYALVIVLLVSVVGVVSYVVTSRTVDENTNEYVFQLVQQINYDIEYYLENVENTMNTVMADDEVIRYFQEGSQDVEGLRHSLSRYMVSREDIINIFLVPKEGQIMVNSGDYVVKPDVAIMDEPWYKDIADGQSTVLSNSHIQNLIQDRYKWVVSWSGRMSEPDSDDFLGVVLVDLNFNLIDDMLANLSLGEKGYMFILDKDGTIIYHPKHELIYSGIKNEAIDLILKSKDGHVTTLEDNRVKNYIVATSDYTGWKVVGAVYEDELKPYDVITRQVYFLISGLAIVIAVILSILISRHYLHPIKDLSEGMDRFKHGHLDTRVDLAMANEFGDLADDFNDMTVQIKRLITENKEKEQAKRKFELKSLQSQINPHFLYNTLDSIVWMAEAGMNEDVVKMTYSLSKLFRISINRGSEFVTMEQELEHIESYLAIQKLRYGDKLDYAISADQDLLSYRMIKIIVQPIVENAIYHGIKKIPGPGFIDIRVWTEGGNIFISVEDNGVGMDQDTVEQLLDKDGHGSLSKGGIGVKNVDQRIKLYYGEPYGVTIESAEFEGTTVTLTLPKEYMGEEVSHEQT